MAMVSYDSYNISYSFLQWRHIRRGYQGKLFSKAMAESGEETSVDEQVSSVVLNCFPAHQRPLRPAVILFSIIQM